MVTCTIRILAKLKGFPVPEMIEIFEFKVDVFFSTRDHKGGV